jgi:hypothetical protein
MPTAEVSTVSSSQQAARLLTAWVSRNPTGLREELRNSLHLDAVRTPQNWEEEERTQLLHAVASSIQQSSAGDPKLRCCVDLLRHLAEMR